MRCAGSGRRSLRRSHSGVRHLRRLHHFLPDFGWSAADLATRLRLPTATIDALLAEEAPVTPDLAVRLGRLFSQTPAFWLKSQLAFDLYFALKAAAGELEEIVPVNAEVTAVRKAS